MLEHKLERKTGFVNQLGKIATTQPRQSCEFQDSNLTCSTYVCVYSQSLVMIGAKTSVLGHLRCKLCSEKTNDLFFFSSAFQSIKCCIRSSDGKRTASRSLCAVKPHSAESVLARGTSMERSVMNTFFSNEYFFFFLLQQLFRFFWLFFTSFFFFFFFLWDFRCICFFQVFFSFQSRFLLNGFHVIRSFRLECECLAKSLATKKIFC